MIRNYIKNTSELKILDIFLRNKDKKYNLSQIKEKAKLKHETVSFHVKKLKQRKILLKDEKYGKSQLYILNQNNELVEALLFMNEIKRK